MIKLKSSIELRVGKLQVVGVPFVINQKAWAVCLCDCGTYKPLRLNDLRMNRTTSCGCTRRLVSAARGRERLTKHGMYSSPEHLAWRNMIARCTCKTHNSYADYGGRGVRVCSAWLASFEAFYSHIGPRPSSSHSLDRINVNGDYVPGNVRWATIETQANNKRNSRVIACNGLALTIPQWSRRLGINLSTLKSRLREGWAISEALQNNEPCGVRE